MAETEPKRAKLEAQASPKIAPEIQQQIRFAQKKFQSFQGTLPSELHKSIHADLDVGNVPPIFHALAMKRDYNTSRGSNFTAPPLASTAVKGSDPEENDTMPFFMGDDGDDAEGFVREDGVPRRFLMDPPVRKLGMHAEMGNTGCAVGERKGRNVRPRSGSNATHKRLRIGRRTGWGALPFESSGNSWGHGFLLCY